MLPVENGSGWVAPPLDALGHSYVSNRASSRKTRSRFFKRNVWIHPFHEDDPLGLIKAIGTDRVVFGSDYPHPEGLADPVSYAKELDSLPREDVVKIMGGNLAEALKIAA